MPKVGQSLSLTFRIGPKDMNQFAKITVDITEIDTEIPLKPQIEKVDNVLQEIWKYIYDKVNDEVTAIQEK